MKVAMAGMFVIGVVAFLVWAYRQLHTRIVDELHAVDPLNEILRIEDGAMFLTGFRYMRHGVEAVAHLKERVWIPRHSDDSMLGRFSITSFADVYGQDAKTLGTSIPYCFQVVVNLVAPGEVALDVIYRRISITNIEPIFCVGPNG